MVESMQRRIDAILDRAPCGYLAIDQAGTVVAANATLADLVGKPREHIEGLPMDVILSSAGRIFHSTHLFPLLRLQGHAEEVYIPLRGPHGADIPVLVNGSARVLDAGGLEYDLIIVPMRQRNELESELLAARRVAEEAAAAKDRFLSIVSHELRTPISAVGGFAELLLRERAGPLTETQRRYAERIRDSAAYQARLIDDILDFARQTGERRRLEPVRVVVDEILDRTEALLAVRAREEGRRVIRERAGRGGAVYADPAAVQQILLNLGANALKFSPPDADVRLTVDAADGRVRIGVRDDGVGIPEADLPRVFEPFVQLESARAHGGGRHGVGLGLPISRDLARAMGGDITVTSVVGAGSTFTLDLPAG